MTLCFRLIVLLFLARLITLPPVYTVAEVGAQTLAGPSTELGTANVQAISPDGKPLSRQYVDICKPGLDDDKETAVFDGVTDSAGWVHLHSNPGLLALQVIAPGVGYGATGYFELRGGDDITVALPPLARFASIRGTIPAWVVRAGSVLAVTSRTRSLAWYRPPVNVNASGQFTASDVIPGTVDIDVFDSASATQPQFGTGYSLVPGQNVTKLNVKKYVYPPEPTEPTNAERPFIDGRVLDATGRPVAGAKVYEAVLDSWGTMLFNQEQYSLYATAVSNADGAFTFQDIRYAKTVLLVASVHGDAPAVRYVPSVPTNIEGFSIGPAEEKADLVLPTSGGSLDITISQFGHAIAGASIELTRLRDCGKDDVNLVENLDSSDSIDLLELLRPTAHAGPNGVARFQDLVPGLYRAVAGATTKSSDLDKINFARDTDFAFGKADGIAVVPRQKTVYQLGIRPHKWKFGFSVLSPSGSIVPGYSFGMSSICSQTGLLDGCSYLTGFENDGTTLMTVSQPGIWSIDTQKRDIPVTYDAVDKEPYDGAVGLIAVDDLTAAPVGITLTSLHREAGSIIVTLRDKIGRPVRGAVYMTDTGAGPSDALSVDSRGDGVFSDIPSGTYTLCAVIYADPERSSLSIPRSIVTVTSGSIARINFKEPAAAPPDVGTFSPKQPPVLFGKVYLDDGVTPAYGASVIADLGAGAPQRIAFVDASGDIDTIGADAGYDWTETPLKTPSGMTVCALLPGSNGAAFGQYVAGQQLRLTLPQSISISGRVTVAGQPISAGASDYEVSAQYVGASPFADDLSIITTAQVDGTFQLNGLTPGFYVVQAARDRIWLSTPVTVAVTGGTSPPPMTIDIPSPGAPIKMHVVNNTGFPLVDTPLAFEMPDGPLTALYWPKSFRTDGAGDISFNGFSAGAQNLVLGGHAYAFHVPPLSSQPGLTEITITVAEQPRQPQASQ